MDGRSGLIYINVVQAAYVHVSIWIGEVHYAYNFYNLVFGCDPIWGIYGISKTNVSEN